MDNFFNLLIDFYNENPRWSKEDLDFEQIYKLAKLATNFPFQKDKIMRDICQLVQQKLPQSDTVDENVLIQLAELSDAFQRIEACENYSKTIYEKATAIFEAGKMSKFAFEYMCELQEQHKMDGYPFKMGDK